MLRWLGRTFLSILLLFLNLAFLSAVALWVRSYWVNDVASWMSRESRRDFASHTGRFVWRSHALLRIDTKIAPPEFVAGIRISHPETLSPAQLSASPSDPLPAHGFALQRHVDSTGSFGAVSTNVLALPAWLVTLVLAHVPAMQLYAGWKRRQRNRKRGFHPDAGAFATVLKPVWRLVVVSSVILSLASGAFWVLSYGNYYGLTRAERFDFDGSVVYRSMSQLAVSNGCLSRIVSRDEMEFHRGIPLMNSNWEFSLMWEAQGHDPKPPPMSSPQTQFQFGAFQFWREVRRVPPSGLLNSLVFASAPLWAAVIACSVLPLTDLVLSIRRDHRRKRRAAGLCPHCHYDLRATPHRCPECGWIPDTVNSSNATV